MDTPEYILFGFQNDTLPELIVRDMNVKPDPRRQFSQVLPHGEYTLRWDPELLDWVITPLTAGRGRTFTLQDVRDWIEKQDS